MKNYEQAVINLKNATELNNEDFYAYLELGKSYYESDQFQQSLTPFNEVINIKESEDVKAEANYFLGLSYFNLAQYSESIESVLAAVSINNTNFNYHYNLGLSYNKISEVDAQNPQFEKSVDAFINAISIDENSSEAHYNLGIAYFNLDRFGEAIEEYKIALNINQKSANTHYHLGRAYYALERWQDSVLSNISALELNPKHSKSHYQLGMTYLKLDDKGSAFDEYKVLKEQDKNLANSLFDSIYQ